MVQKLRERSRGDGGFTLVELLVVMLILGLLAAIAIPSFFNQRDKARDADAKADARTAQTAMETYATDNQGAYTGATVARLQAIETTLNDATLAVDVAGTAVDLDGTGAGAAVATDYIVRATSDTGNVFTIARAASGETGLVCTVAGDAGCPTNGTWG